MGTLINEKLNMSPSGRSPVIRIGQYDSDFSIVFSLYSVGNATWTMESGTTAKIRGTKTDGTGYSADCTVDVTNRKVTVTGDQQMTASAGNCIYEIVLYKGTKELSSVNFILKVERAALDAETIPSESKIKEIQELGTKADEIIEAYENLEFDSTPTEDSTKAVTSGGVKTYVDQLDTATNDRIDTLDEAVDGYVSVASHFYFEGKEPYIDSQNRTITFHSACPFIVNGKRYGSYKYTDTVINIPAWSSSDPNYYIIYLDLSQSDVSTLTFLFVLSYTPVNRNMAYIGQFNIQNFIFSFPFNVNIDGTLYYALGKDVYPRLGSIENAMIVDCDYVTYSGGYIQASNGYVGSNPNTGYTGYIDVSSFSTIRNPIDHAATYQMAFYDEDKTYISGALDNTAQIKQWIIPVPSGAKYARLSFYLDVEDTFYCQGVLNDLGKYIESNSSSDTRLKGKKLGIVGDSISTYSGYIPSGYATFYPRNTVTDVEKTWWKQLLNETGMELCVNASWSGSTISGDTSRTDGYVGCSDARVNALTKANGDVPDIIICFMGINDFGKNNNITCGSYEGKTSVSTDVNITEITTAYGVLLKKLQIKYPNALIFVCRILPEQFSSEMSGSYANGFPNVNPNDNVSLPELNERIEKIANAFNCGIIPMDKCGVTFWNLETYTGDKLHPNAALTPKMCQIAKQSLLNFF